MRRVLDLFTEQGTVDEMGLGSLTQLIADDLFPGTSVIQTRLRYVLFVPWLYQSLERKRVTSADVGKAARSAEIGLIESLVRSEDTAGVIGARARGGLTRLPSEVYWPALVLAVFSARPEQELVPAALFELGEGRGRNGTRR